MSDFDFDDLNIQLDGAVNTPEEDRGELVARVEEARKQLEHTNGAAADATGIASKHLVHASRTDVKAVSSVMTDILHMGSESRGHENGIEVINDMLLGELLVELGFVTQDDVDDALEYQIGENCRIGDALVAMGRASLADVETAVHLQDHLHRAAVVRSIADPNVRSVRAKVLNRMLLGQILLAAGEVTNAQLEEAMRVQRQTEGLHLGEALVQIGATTTEAIEEALELQRAARESEGGEG